MPEEKSVDRNQLCELRQFIAMDGRRIQQLLPVGDVDLEVQFKGVVMLITPAGPREMNFPIVGAEDIQQAVEMFDDAANEAVEEVKKQQRQPKIAVPGHMANIPNAQNQSGNIVTP